MNFIELLNDYVGKRTLESEKKLLKIIDSGALDEVSPFETLCATSHVLQRSVNKILGKSEKQGEEEIIELKKGIESIVNDMFNKFSEEEGAAGLAYRRVGLLLITIGTRYYAPEHYENEMVKEMLDKGELTRDHLQEIASNDLCNINIEDLERIKAIVNNSKDDEDTFAEIESGSYDVKYIYDMLANKEITAIDIMQNVSAPAYDKLMKDLSEYNNKSTKEEKQEKTENKNFSEMSPMFKDIVDNIPKGLKDSILSDLRTTGIPERVLNSIIECSRKDFYTQERDGEDKYRLLIVNNKASVEDIIKMMDDCVINPCWLTVYLADHGRKSELNTVLSRIMLKQLS